MEIKIEIENKGYKYKASASLSGGSSYLSSDVCEKLLLDILSEVKKR